MKKILLSQNKYALVDDEDYEYLNQHKWSVLKNRDGSVYYAVRRKGGGHVSMHREIMKVLDGKIFVDHKDHDGLNNQKSNLRLCNNSENKKNVRSKTNSTSKYLGVSWYKKSSRWRAGITVGGKNITLGYSKDEKEAASIYNIHAKKYHGEFANLNIL